MNITQSEIEALEKLLDWAHEEALEQRQSPEHEAAAHESMPPMDDAMDEEMPMDDEGADVEIELKPKRSIIGKYDLGVGGGSEEPKPQASKMPVRRRY